MSNRPRDKGTAAESQVVGWFVAAGETQVERRALNGAKDRGDIAGLPGLVISVKHVGRDVPMRLSTWLSDLDRMRANVAADAPTLDRPDGLVIVRRVGYRNVGDWYAVQRVEDWWHGYSEHWLT